MTATDQELLDDILLSQVEGVGSRTYQKLLERFGNSTAILNASRSDFAGFSFQNLNTLERLLSARKSFNPETILDYCRRKEIDILSIRETRYPASLRQIDDPPPLLYVQGSLLPQDALAIAVIGTRRISAYGRKQANRLTSALVQHGFTIVSGLARGVDAVAHKTALQAGGRTIAVLGSGHHKLYPPEHDLLVRQILESDSAVISEYPPLHPSASWTFPQRNRIVSGLSLGVLVVEAPLRSGAMISARLAGEQGRDIFAIPGPIDGELSRGCHQLIRDGAYLAESVDDILDALGPLAQSFQHSGGVAEMRHPAEMTLNEIEQTILDSIGLSPCSIISIKEHCGLADHQIQAVLLVLEEKRIIRRTKNQRFIRI